MSELAEFVEESVVEDTPVEEVKEEVQEPEVEAKPEPEAEVAEEPEGLPTEPEKPEKTGEVPIAALLDEREKRQAFEKKYNELLTQQAKPQEPAPDILEDQEGFLKHFTSQMQQERLSDRIELSQEVMRMQHEDYDEAEAAFMQMAQENPELGQQLAAAKLPAKFVYDTVKKAEKLAAMENVDEWEAKKTAELEAKIRAELETKAQAAAKAKADAGESLSPSLTAHRAEGGNREVITVADPLDTTFNR